MVTSLGLVLFVCYCRVLLLAKRYNRNCKLLCFNLWAFWRMNSRVSNHWVDVYSLGYKVSLTTLWVNTQIKVGGDLKGPGSLGLNEKRWFPLLALLGAYVQSLQNTHKNSVCNSFFVYLGCCRKKAEHRRIDTFELWCWRSLLRVPWTAGRSNQSILKEISPEYSLEGLMLKLNL